MCPVRNCQLTCKKRADVCTHFLDAHFQTDDTGVEVRPFICKTCNVSEIYACSPLLIILKPKLYFRKVLDICSSYLASTIRKVSPLISIFVCFPDFVQEKFRDVLLLIKHGECIHPKSKWVKPLKMGVEDRC